jgi:hypothetical protein
MLLFFRARMGWQDQKGFLSGGCLFYCIIKGHCNNLSFSIL